MMNVALPFQKKLFLMLFLFAGLQLVSSQKGKQHVEQQAIELMQAYQSELGLTIGQAETFRLKIEEYLLRRNAINKQAITAKEKLQELQKISDQETAEMESILNAQQHREYKKMKKTLQRVQVEAAVDME